MVQYVRYGLLLLLYCLGNTVLNAQTVVLGKVVTNNRDKKPLPAATITNKASGIIVYANENAEYKISASVGDTLVATFVGYLPSEYILKYASGIIQKTFFLTEKRNVLNEVKVSGLTAYQKDSLDRATRYDKALGYEQTATIASPVTSLYEQFSKKYKDLRKFQGQVKGYEEQKYIDTKYSYNLVNAITQLTGDEAAYFMNAYPMEYKFARLATDLELKQWIIDNFKEYKKIKKSVILKNDSLLNTTKPQ
jgi:hypothetical protein